MKRLALFALWTALGGCAASADVASTGPAYPPPPPPTATATVAVDNPSASSTVEVDVAPAPEAEPEELVATSEPPEPVYEEQGDAPGADVVWVGGYWQWAGSDWGWYYGGWYPAPEGRRFTSPPTTSTSTATSCTCAGTGARRARSLATTAATGSSSRQPFDRRGTSAGRMSLSRGAPACRPAGEATTVRGPPA